MSGEPSDQRFRAMLEALPMAVYATDAAGRITFFNDAAAEFAGHRPEIGTDKWCVTWRLLRPDGTPLPHDQCPMAVTLREQRPVRGQEAIAERPDGSRVRFEPYPTPFFDEQGNLAGAINVLIDITDRHDSGVQAARLAAIVASSDDAIVSKSLDGRVTSWNRGAANIFGYEPEEMIGQPITRIIPPELLSEEEHIIARLKRGERIDHFETTRVAKNGRRLDISLTVSPIYDNSGKVVGASKVARDITEKKRAEATRQLLLNELNHRVKNTLANVQAIVQHTVRHARSPDEFAASFSGRIQSLARVHSLLTSTTWHGADLRELIHDQLLNNNLDETKLTIWGPAVRLDPQMTVHMALMLHELGTNSAKHGAMSVKDGQIAIGWTVRDEELRFLWVERGAVAVTAPVKRGFGMTLIEQSAASQGGTAHVSWEADGASWEIMLPLREVEPLPQELPSALADATPGAVVPLRAAAEKGQTMLSGQRLLVVEDEPLIGLDIVCTLQDAGANVVGPAGSEEEALRIIASGSFDAALLDANLHGKPVDQIAAALTRHNIPFAFVSGHGRDGLPQSFAMAPLVGKPFTQEQLLQVVRQLLQAGSGAARLAR